MNTRTCLCALLACCSLAGAAHAYDLPKPPGQDRIYFEADKASYDKGNDSIHLQGHALLLEYGLKDSSAPAKVTKGEDLRIFPSSHVFVSSGAVLMEDGGGAVFGYDAKFDWENKVGGLRNVNATYSPWRVLKAKRMESRKGGTYVFKRGRITSCDYESEHYSFGFSRMHITPDDKLWGLNVFFFLGRIPVFYLPFMYRPLGKDAKYVTYLEPGYDKRNGMFLKSIIYHRYSKNITSRLFLDYYAKIGLGTGAEMAWNNTKDFNGSIAAYRIKDNDKQRWGLYGGYWKQFYNDKPCPACAGTMYFSQGQMRMVSDPFFNNDYFRDNPYAVSPDRQASVAVVRQGTRTTTRVSFFSQAQVLQNRPNFVTTYESYPRIDFSLPAFYIPGLKGVVNSFTAFYDRAQYTDYTYYQQSAYAQWTMSKSVPLVKHLSLLPSVYYTQALQVHPHKADGTPDMNYWTGTYGTNWVLRYDTLLGTLDTGYYYMRRFQPNSLNVESAATDAGISTNTLAMQLFVRPNRYFYFKMGSAYDFRYVQGQSLDFDQRIMPIATEVLYTPNDKLNLFARNYYQIRDGSRAFVFQAGWGAADETGVGLGFSNYKADQSANIINPISERVQQMNSMKMGPGAYIVNPVVRWVPPNATWRLDLGMNFYAYTTGGIHFKTLMMYEKNLTLYKIFHDFSTQWYVKIRPGVETIGFMANLRFNDPTPRRATTEEQQRFGDGWQYAGATMP